LSEPTKPAEPDTGVVIPKVVPSDAWNEYHAQLQEGVKKIPVLNQGLDDYFDNPQDLINVLEENGLREYSRDGNTIVLRGIYKNEIGKTPHRSWDSPDGVRKSRLNGTSGVLLSGDFSIDPHRIVSNHIQSATERIKSYGDTDYIAILRGHLDSSYSNDIQEAVITNPEVIAYIPRKSISDFTPTDVSTPPSTPQHNPPLKVGQRRSSVKKAEIHDFMKGRSRGDLSERLDYLKSRRDLGGEKQFKYWQEKVDEVESLLAAASVPTSIKQHGLASKWIKENKVGRLVLVAGKYAVRSDADSVTRRMAKLANKNG
jgi:hypothetical protein